MAFTRAHHTKHSNTGLLFLATCRVARQSQLRQAGWPIGQQGNTVATGQHKHARTHSVLLALLRPQSGSAAPGDGRKRHAHSSLRSATAAPAGRPYVSRRYWMMAVDSHMQTPALGSSRKGIWQRWSVCRARAESQDARGSGRERRLLQTALTHAAAAGSPLPSGTPPACDRAPCSLLPT